MTANTYKGGGTCGAIRYETRDRPIFENHCQCTDCQKRSGTGHGTYGIRGQAWDMSDPATSKFERMPQG